MKTFSEVEYQRPDIAKLSQAIVDYTAAVKAAASAEEVYQLLVDHKATMDEYTTMRGLANIRNSIDTRDPFYAGEKAFFDQEGPKLNLLLRDANDALLASPFRPQLEEKLGALFFKNMETSKRFADERIVDDQIRQSQMTQRYSKVVATAVTTFHGEECNFSRLLKYMQSADRNVRREAFQAWAALYEKISPELDEIYDELVHLRHGMAMKLGFPSFTEMAYLELQRYDYSIEDAASFRRQVREVITPACEKLFARQAQRLNVDKLHYYDEALFYPEGNPVPQGTRQELVAKAQQMYREMAPEAGEFFDAMVEHDMFDLETKPGKRLGGFCSSLHKYRLPFIFANFNGTSADVDVLTHEAGHAFECYLAFRAHPFVELAFSTSEIAEIHSMTMEHFAYPWMPLFFGDQAEKYRVAHLTDALTVIPYLVSVDEYQHRVFEKPDMTAKERRAAWREIEKAYMPWRDYDGNAFLEEGGFWMQKPHIFLDPFYYIEYALAQTCAFQFYDGMKKDRAKAWEDYCRLCRAGGSLGYFQLLQLAGLRSPFEPGSVAQSVAGVLEELGV